MACDRFDDVSAYADAELPTAAAADLEQHLAACAACAQRLAQLRALADRFVRLRAARAPESLQPRLRRALLDRRQPPLLQRCAAVAAGALLTLGLTWLVAGRPITGGLGDRAPEPLWLGAPQLVVGSSGGVEWPAEVLLVDHILLEDRPR